MSTYYVSSSNQYNFLNLIKSIQSIPELQKIILYTPSFCRDQQSISTNELKSYIVSGITFFTKNALNQVVGLINFDINQQRLNILGICVPGLSQGIGSSLIHLVKQFAKANNITSIHLTCYDNLKSFYIKQGFKIENQSSVYDSDEESDNQKTRFDMVFSLLSGGKRRKSMKRIRLKKKRKTVKKNLS